MLIADSGSTRTQWAAIDGSGATVVFEGGGINALMLSGEELRGELRTQLEGHIMPRSVECVRFYGAGCVPSVIPEVTAALREVTGCEDVEVASDMLAAARALCGDEPGIACILGTGSNSCEYDGQNISANVSPLGYILGDEGSGAVLGRRLVGDVLKNQLPAELCRGFMERFDLTQLDIIEAVYREQGANRFLAGFVPFLSENIRCEEIEEMVIDEFVRFLRRNVAGYSVAGSATVNFAGSVAYYFRPQLQKAVTMCGMRLGNVVREPIGGLVNYHLSKFKNNR